MITSKKILSIIILCSLFFTSFTKNILYNRNHCVTSFSSTSKQLTYQDYIANYAYYAVQSMKKFKIPASIIIAQGMLETSYGNSKLSQQSNNHFGLKCGNTWNGYSILHNDDNEQECFRVYSSVKDSFLDHGHFIKNRPWYIFLFQLPTNDYKNWAIGLQEAGYATDPYYSKKLIDIIERYSLYQLDYM